MSNQTFSYDTIVIGGGQAGLATGYYLQQQERDFVILEAHNRIGDVWRERWDSLRLFTPGRYNRLPGMDFPGSAHAHPSKDEMAAYLESYADRFQLPVKTAVMVDSITREGDRFIVTATTTGAGRSRPLRYEAYNVVVAAGGRPWMPEFASELNADIYQIHSSKYRHPSQLQDGDVLVVGAGNSGAEIALELSSSHRTWLSGRHPGNEPFRPESRLDRLTTPLLWFALSRILTLDTPIGRKVAPHLREHGTPLARVRADDLAASGVERVFSRTVGTQAGLPVLDDGRVLDVSNVIWCTGFRQDFKWIDLPIFDESGSPLHDRGVVAKEPGLYFVGLTFQSAAISSLVGGVGKDAENIVKLLTSRSRAPQPVLAGHMA